MNKVFAFLFFLFSFSIQAQKGVFSSSNVKGVDSKVDNLPYFMYEKAELDTFLLNNEIMHAEEEKWGVNTYVYMSFIVDSLGKPCDLKVHYIDIKLNALTEVKNYNYIDTIKAYYTKESSRLIYLTEGMWVSNISNRANRLEIIIPFRTETYVKKNGKALQPSNEGSFSGKIIYVGDPYSGEINTAKNIYKYYDYGVQKLNQNKLQLAKKYFIQALRVKKDDIDALYNLGVCYVKLKDYTNACNA